MARTESVASEDAAGVLGPFLSLFLGMDNVVASNETHRALGWQTGDAPTLLSDLRDGSYRTNA